MSTGKSSKYVSHSRTGAQERTTNNLLHANDRLELLDDITLSDYDANKLIVTRLKSNNPDDEKHMTVLVSFKIFFLSDGKSFLKADWLSSHVCPSAVADWLHAALHFIFEQCNSNLLCTLELC